MAANLMDLFKTVILVQLFYAFVITGFAYAIPPGAHQYIDAYSELSDSIGLESVSTEVQDSIERQANIPVIELGALVFYSGNILLDLLLNFAFAIPQMIGILVNALMTILAIDTEIFILVQLFFSVLVMVMYFLGLMQLVTSIRSGQGVF